MKIGFKVQGSGFSTLVVAIIKNVAWAAGVLMALAVAAGRSGFARAADEWPQFRGPDGQGHAPQAEPPLEWSDTSNVVWKTPIPGLGWSSPVVGGSQIWLTTAHEPSRTLRAICLDRGTGRVLHDVEVFRPGELPRIAAKNSHASPTPVLDGGFVYVHFGSQGTACLARDGQVVWRAKLDYDQHHGSGGSPVVWRDLLIVLCDGYETQSAVALDKRTGQVRWQQPLEAEMAYSTPLLVPVGAAEQLVCDDGRAIIGRDPASGQELWRYRHDGHSVVPRPVFGHGLIYACSGYWTPRLYALRAGGQGDVTETHLAWSARRGVPHTPSPLLVGDELYLLSDQGVVTCLDARNGKERWRQRFNGAFSASPVEAGGRIYLTNEEGTTFVISPGSQYDLLAVNQLAGRTLATPAFAGRSVFLRTDAALYHLQEPAAARSASQLSGVPGNADGKAKR